jgi:PAS domain S-box-containing protein
MKNIDKAKKKLKQQISKLQRRQNDHRDRTKRKEKYKYIYDENPLLNIIVGEDGKIKEVNNAVVKYLGYSRQEIIGKLVLDFVTPEHREETANLLKAIIERKENPEIEIDVQAKDGSVRRILISKGQALLYEEGQVTGALVIGLDITERKEVERRLKENQYMLRQVIDTSPDIIFVISKDEQIILANKSLAEFYSTTVGEIEGITQSELHRKFKMRTNELRKWLVDDLKALEEGRMVEFIEFGHNRSGQGIWYRTRKCPLSLGKEKEAILVISGNIDNLKKTELALRESEKKYYSLFTSMVEAVAIHEIVYDEKGKAIDFTIGEVNPAYEPNVGMSAEEVQGKRVTEIFGFAPFLDIYAKVAETGEPTSFEAYLPPLKKYFRISAFSLRKGNFVTVFTDITQRKEAEEALSRQQVLLEEKNIALKQLIDQVELEKRRIEEQVRTNVDRLLIPLLMKMKGKGSQLDSMYIELMKDNLKIITSSFGRKISKEEFGLTTREIEICNLIKSGLTSKEIGEILNVCYRTIETHRNNIRKKLGLKDRKINLTTYLKSLDSITS